MKRLSVPERQTDMVELIEWERLDSSSRKLEISRDYFMQIWAQ